MDEIAEKQTPKLTVGDVVQVDPASNPRFGGCFIVVDAVHSRWGVVGHCQSPGDKDRQNSMLGSFRVYFQCAHEEVVRIGRAEWMRNNA